MVRQVVTIVRPTYHSRIRRNTRPPGARVVDDWAMLRDFALEHGYRLTGPVTLSFDSEDVLRISARLARRRPEISLQNIADAHDLLHEDRSPLSEDALRRRLQRLLPPQIPHLGAIQFFPQEPQRRPFVIPPTCYHDSSSPESHRTRRAQRNRRRTAASNGNVVLTSYPFFTLNRTQPGIVRRNAVNVGEGPSFAEGVASEHQSRVISSSSQQSPRTVGDVLSTRPSLSPLQHDGGLLLAPVGMSQEDQDCLLSPIDILSPAAASVLPSPQEWMPLNVEEIPTSEFLEDLLYSLDFVANVSPL